jgi:hypothetical protein
MFLGWGCSSVVEPLPSKCKTLDLILSTKKRGGGEPCMVVHAYNPITQEAEAGGSCVQS